MLALVGLATVGAVAEAGTKARPLRRSLLVSVYKVTLLAVEMLIAVL